MDVKAHKLTETQGVLADHHRSAEREKCAQKSLDPFLNSDSIVATEVKEDNLHDRMDQTNFILLQDIHDCGGYYLTLLSISMKNLEEAINDQSAFPIIASIKTLIAAFADDLGQIATTGKECSSGLFSEFLKDFMLQWSKSSGLLTKLRSNCQDIELNLEIKRCLLRITQESLTNISRHSQSTQIVKIYMIKRKDYLYFTIIDDGCGFVATPELSFLLDHSHQCNNNRLWSQGMGLLGMATRLSRLGGEVRVVSSPGQGTKISVRIKLPSGS